MSVVDVLVLAGLLAAIAGGYRMGFFVRVTSWLGLAVGLWFGAVFLVPMVVEALSSASTVLLVVAALGAPLVTAGIGQAIGGSIAARVRWAVPPGLPRRLDHLGGAGAGSLGVLALVWLLAPVLIEIPGAVARAIRTSAIVDVVQAVAPRPPQAVREFRAAVNDGLFPEVFADQTLAPQIGPPPEELPLSTEVRARAVESAVAVEALACAQRQEGSGFVAEPEVVVTNAHVVAGSDDVEVLDPRGDRLAADVVRFDDDRDLAVLSVPGLDAPALPFGPSSGGTAGGILGFPLGQDQVRVASAAVDSQVMAVGHDIYGDDRVRREVLVTSAELDRGDSGAAFVDRSGAVVGVAFAVAPDRPQTAYALARSEVDAVLPPPGGDVDTGPCLR